MDWFLEKIIDASFFLLKIILVAIDYIVDPEFRKDIHSTDEE